MLKMEMSPKAIEILNERQDSKSVYWQVTMYEFSWWEPPKFELAPVEQKEEQDLIFHYNDVKILVPREISTLVKKISIIYEKPKVKVKVYYNS